MAIGSAEIRESNKTEAEGIESLFVVCEFFDVVELADINSAPGAVKYCLFCCWCSWEEEEIEQVATLEEEFETKTPS
uniref:Uncharacterized protein n=1 Tax=Meloidogyne floridensis TaxID=298350 RepID=A0A915P5Q6_9BILA